MNAAFKDRQEAGRKLAIQLASYQNHPQTMVLGVPRGGVPTAYEVAKNLNLPLDVCLVAKVRLPDHPRSMGALVEDTLVPNYGGGIVVIGGNIEPDSGLSHWNLLSDRYAARAQAELRWRECCYRHHRPWLKVAGNSIILVDDGMVTGTTMQAAIAALRLHNPQQIIIAVPVAPKTTLQKLATVADRVVCLATPATLGSIGFWYEDFERVSDREICELLARQSASLVESCHLLNR